MTTTTRRWWATLGVVTVAGLLSLAVAALPASGQAAVQQQSPVQATVKVVAATLVAKGAAVEVTVEYQCLPGVTINSLEVLLSQRFGKTVTSGSAYLYGGPVPFEPCAGFVPVQKVLTVYPTGTRFKKGEAAVSATLTGWSSQYSYFSITNDQVINVSG